MMNQIVEQFKWLQSVQPAPVWLAGAALLLLVAWLAVTGWLARRRTGAIYAALAAATRSHLLYSEPRRATRLRLVFDPAPEPFAHLGVEFVLRRGGLPALPAARAARRQMLHFAGMLSSPPQAELVWQADHAPAHAVGRGPDTELWVNRRLVYAPGEYALRGQNPAALEHAFLALQTRYGPYVRSVLVQRAATPHLRVTLAAGRLNIEDVPALVAAVRALGRAAHMG